MNKKELEICSSMRKNCAAILENNDLDSIKGIRKNLYQLINSLQKFEKTPFADYMYLPIMLPLNMALDIMQKKDSTVELEEVYEYFYDFMRAFNLCVQNSNRSDRQFTQTPEFNIRLYDIPTKMYAFYYAYVYNLREYLNAVSRDDLQNEYEFLICQGITNSLRVEKCFKKMSREKGLFIVEIPERAAFEPQMMLITLTHELGHVVGAQIRLRPERVKILEQIACKILCKYTKIKWLQRDKGSENEILSVDQYWTRFEEDLLRKLFPDTYTEDFIQRVYRNTGNKDLKKRLKEQKDYGVFVIEIIFDRMSRYINDDTEDIFGYLTTNQYIDWLNKEPERAKEKAVQLQSNLLEILGNMKQFNVWDQDDFNLKRVLSLTLNLMRECLADIICIMTLKLSLQKYLETIVVNLKQLGETEFDGTVILLRSSLVTRCMLNETGHPDYSFQWSDDSLKDIEEDVEVRLKENIIDTIQVYMPMEGDTEDYDDRKRDVKGALGMLYDPDILERISFYLMRCKEQYITSCTRDGMQGKREQLQTVYDMFDKDKAFGVKDIVIEQQEYIDDYLRRLKEKMQGIKKTSYENR